jgi:RNA polymerase sigma-70 factor (ECF subfamily)
VSHNQPWYVNAGCNGVPLDTLVIELGSSRGAIYKMMFDARRKLRAALAANGYMGQDTAEST